MKLKKLLIMILTVLCLTGAAGAEADLYAAYANGTLNIRWNAEGACVLTVYRNNWPIKVSNVDGASGGTDVYVGKSGGRYSVRLRTADGCLTANAESSGTSIPTAMPDATEAPVMTAVPTMLPTAVPAVTPVATPVVKPTAMPIVTPTATMPAGGQSMTSYAAEVISQVNAERAKYGLSPLTVDANLTSAARIRAAEIVERFSHTRPDGSSWSTVSEYAMGENIAMGHNSPDRVMAAWMTSDGHRANILRGSFGSIGVCALKVNGVIYWVQLFGR